MSTYNGCGTTYYGWENDGETSRTATRWLVILFFPIVPLGRVRIEDSRPQEKFFDAKPTDVFVPSYSDQFRIVEELSIDWKSAGMTYLNAYLLFPFALLAPILVLVLIAKVVGKSFDLSVPVRAVFLAFLTVYWILAGVFVIRKTRGKTGL
jgi:hypothetical protein